MWFKPLALFGFLQLSSCASNELVFSDKVVVDPITGQQAGQPNYAPSQGHHVVSAGGTVQWFGCTQSVAATSMVLINPGPQAWSPEEVCKTPAALAFMNQGLNVIAINRPKGETLGDDIALEQVKETVDFLQKENRRLEGLWSMGEGSVLALRLARLYPWKLLIIGNGIYDLELAMKESADQSFLARVKAMPGSNDPVFVEKRSAAWDLSGLPKMVYLYHGGQNTQVSANQATQFRNSLAASEYRVELSILDEDTQELRPDYHRGVLGKILENYRKPE
jgi:hypothetical protein